MGPITAKTQNLSDLFHNQLSTLYGLETQRRTTLKKMAEVTTDPAVRKELTAAAKKSESHAARLDEVFASIDAKPDAMRRGRADAMLPECRDVTTGSAEAHCPGRIARCDGPGDRAERDRPFPDRPSAGRDPSSGTRPDRH